MYEIPRYARNDNYTSLAEQRLKRYKICLVAVLYKQLLQSKSATQEKLSRSNGAGYIKKFSIFPTSIVGVNSHLVVVLKTHFGLSFSVRKGISFLQHGVPG